MKFEIATHRNDCHNSNLVLFCIIPIETIKIIPLKTPKKSTALKRVLLVKSKIFAIIGGKPTVQ